MQYASNIALRAQGVQKKGKTCPLPGDNHHAAEGSETICAQERADNNNKIIAASLL
jgi:hypothetical protein